MLKVRDEAENLQLIIETWHQTELGRKVSAQKLNMRREGISIYTGDFPVGAALQNFKQRKYFFSKTQRKVSTTLIKGDH